MGKKSNLDLFLEHLPAFTVWYNIVLTYLLQFLIFILIIIFFWWISPLFNYGLGAIIGQIIVISIGTIPYAYMFLNSEKIRVKYKKKYKKLAAQRLWYNYISYLIPILYSSLYFPLLLITYNDLPIPSIIPLQSSFMTNSLFPFFVSIPIGVILVILGILTRKPSGGFGADVDSCMYLIYPEKSKLIQLGIYKYIRHPRYLSRFFIAIGFGFIANNFLAICVGFLHFLPFAFLVMPEEKELSRRFGVDYANYKKRVPALFPKLGKWIKFVKFLFGKEKSKI